jgi:hypothetical protein
MRTIPTSTSNRPDSPSEPFASTVAVVVVAVMTVVALVVAAVVAWYWWVREPPRDPIVRFAQAVPADVERETRTAVAEFSDVFRERRPCLPTAHVVLVRDVDGGDARYLADSAVIEIEIPTTPARFRESLVHELAHHVESTCPAFAGLRDEWLARSGDGTWSGQERWEDRPTEQWAEAVVALVLGERLLHGDEMTVDADLVTVARDWLDP